MKALRIAAVLAMVAGLVQAAPPRNVQVSTNSVKILPSRTMKNAPDWAATTAYVQGQYVEGVSKRIYMCVTAGTSGSTEPSHNHGEAADGTVTWYRVPKQLRAGFAVVNDSTNVVYCSVGWTAVVNRGIRLNPSGGSFSMDNDSMQDEVFVVSGSVSNNITVQEWP